LNIQDSLSDELYFTVVITSTETPTYAELCEAYDDVYFGRDADEEELPRELHMSLRSVTPQKGKVKFLVKGFSAVVSSNQAFDWARSRNYRLAFPWEREAFAKANPDLQKRFWIVDLGSFTQEWELSVPVLGEMNQKRALHESAYDNEWPNGYTYFLFVRDTPSE